MRREGSFSTLVWVKIGSTGGATCNVLRRTLFLSRRFDDVPARK